MAFDLDNLRVFLAAIDHGSFSAAARALGRVPSAVSMTIANLEAQLDLTLFDRTGREPVATPQGLALVPQARRIAEQLGQLNRHALSMTQGLEPALVIAVVPELVAATPWSDALGTLSAEFPLLEVEVLTAPQADALAMLKSGRAHLALVFERQGLDPAERFQEVARETLLAVVAASHPMLARATTSTLRDEDLIGERQILVAGRDACDVDKRISVSRTQWRTDSPVAALRLVSAGLGWAWLPSGFVRGALASGELVQIPAGNFTTALQLYVDVAWTQNRPLGLAARRFVELMGASATLSGSAPDPANPSAARSRAGKRRSSATSG
ncbi:MAG: LysR family transcriptional regulator [Mitsuaria chitosanitabida]|jgi:DNA-binding transcriptional LysR family regulator|uniref:LysR family transcriptional regulator n=1 Tax=Roseateles chitosanitabidus TaxID=65048 RepID=UPI001B05D912|nr:LysR family transcriptional regulator [Roseateles chitosanitabidus]MBO9686173.1 LysR family transcriptional regulator [Roseateles chitosanitabidus]